jgi:flavin-dependent dehydrogenase
VDLLGAREKMDQYGYVHKDGAYLEWGKETWPLNFGELMGNRTYGYQVIRSEFDHMLLKHAAEQGAHVFEGVEVRSIHFDGDRPVRATYMIKGENGGGGTLGEISFDYLVDASGRKGVMANSYLNNRRFHEVFKNIASGVIERRRPLGTGRDGDIAVGSYPMLDLGYPLHDGTMSVGVVMPRMPSLHGRGRHGGDLPCDPCLH